MYKKDNNKSSRDRLFQLKRRRAAASTVGSSNGIGQIRVHVAGNLGAVGLLDLLLASPIGSRDWIGTGAGAGAGEVLGNPSHRGWVAGSGYGRSRFCMLGPGTALARTQDPGSY